MRNISDEIVEKTKTHFIFCNFFGNLAVCDTKLKNVVHPEGPQMTIWRMRISHYVLKATNAHSQYVILIAFPLQQCLHELASVLRFTYVACHIIYVESLPAAEFCFYILIFLYSETLVHI